MMEDTLRYWRGVPLPDHTAIDDVIRYGVRLIKHMARLRSPHYEFPADSHIERVVSDIVAIARTEHSMNIKNTFKTLFPTEEYDENTALPKLFDEVTRLRDEVAALKVKTNVLEAEIKAK